MSLFLMCFMTFTCILLRLLVIPIGLACERVVVTVASNAALLEHQQFTKNINPRGHHLTQTSRRKQVRNNVAKIQVQQGSPFSSTCFISSIQLGFGSLCITLQKTVSINFHIYVTVTPQSCLLEISKDLFFLYSNLVSTF